MKQHANNYFVKKMAKPISQVSTNSAVTRSNELKPTSYLTFTRSKHRRKNETTIKLPELQPSSARAKTEQDQIAQNEFKKSIVIISRKPSATLISQRIKTSPSIQLWEPEYVIKPLAEEVQVLTPKFYDVLCEELVLSQKQSKIKEKNHIFCKTKLNEYDKFQDKSSRMIRKIIQLLKTHRERNEERELKSKTMIETQMAKSNIFFHAQTYYLPEQPHFNQRELLFQQQLSVIPKRHTKYSSQLTLTHQAESFKPMKSLIEEIKEKQQDPIKQASICLVSPNCQQNNQKKIKLVIECAEEQKYKQFEFFAPEYMEQDQLVSVQLINNVVESKDTKQSNIYSLVSKNMFSKKMNQIQNLNGSTLDEFNSDKATQFTRYYLQNYVLKCINQKKIKDKKDSKPSLNILKQDTKLEPQIFVSKFPLDCSIIKDFQTTQFVEIHSEIYRCIEPFDSQDSSMISDNSFLNDKSNIDFSTDQGYKLKLLLTSNLIDPRVIQENLIKFVISTISDESKNVLLHQEIMAFANQVEQVIHIDYDLPHQPHLEALNRLFLRINKNDRKKFLKSFLKKFDLISIGYFEDCFKHQLKNQERKFVKLCYQQQSNSLTDNTSLKYSNMLKSRHHRETTVETIPIQQTNLMILSLPPAPVKSRSESPSNLSDSRTQKNSRQNQQVLIKNIFKKQSQRFLQVQTSSKFQLQQQTPQVQKLSIVKEKEQQNINKQNQKISLNSIQNNLKYLSMDPQSLLLRNMMIQKTKNDDKTLYERIFLMVCEHRLQDLKEILKLETSIDLNFQNDDGDTMLISASQCGAASIVEFLIKNGADVSIQNYNGQTAMDVALKNYQFQTADIIFKYLYPDNKNL
ncbi:unnamed protein product (macronuclear) [Paramecium tetraurelia]|uniref:Uncharacterized protein n=1 Tax=Paramecium tetraurelia TaxID=5888 RepID=A0CQR1_PARTE|nr:uncharacterized protein GSPATT00009476001 [Paramecium tetraurelia]CAK73128.1 unnamed protein product [Paramecium tetraurelia]|eukprot:XP_001440525.1 hypothetical protein (macronuclear) [Paramecium tetraurelia strain d4-2]